MACSIMPGAEFGLVDVWILMDEILRRDLLRYSFLYLVFDTVVRCIF